MGGSPGTGAVGPGVEAVGPCCHSVGFRVGVVGSTDVVGYNTALGMEVLGIAAVSWKRVEPRVCRGLGVLGGSMVSAGSRLACSGMGDSVGHARWCSYSWGCQQCG